MPASFDPDWRWIDQALRQLHRRRQLTSKLDGWIGTGLWILQAFVVCAVVVHLSALEAERIAPLTALLNLNLVFPDSAPSRFRTALRAGTVRKITSGELVLSRDEQEAAEQAIELVGRLTKHERLGLAELIS